MTRTNFDKLIRWDADFYKSLTDDDCIVCLTEREVYLAGQILDALRWKNTRWIGNIVGLDFDDIADKLEYKFEERMTCKDVSDIFQKIANLESKIVRYRLKPVMTMVRMQFGARLSQLSIL